MNPKKSIAEKLSVARSWRSCLQLLVVLAVLCAGSLARAIQTDTWSGASGATALSGLNTWKTAGNWSGSVLPLTPAPGDTFIFPASPTWFFSTNGFVGLTANSITFNASGYILNGNAITNIAGMTDNNGANSNSIPIVIGAPQTFQNNSGSGFTNTETGTINLLTNTLTLGGSAPIFFNGVISSTNGGTLIINNSLNARLAAANSFGTNSVSITNLFTPTSFVTNITYYTNSYAVVGPGGFTNYTYITNTVIVTNGTFAFTTNVLGPQNADVVDVQGGGVLQLNNAGAIPGGATVGNVKVDGTVDLNGQSPTINGLEDSGFTGANFVDNINAANTGSYVLTVGNANSNAVFNGVIQNTVGTVGLTKIGFGTETLAAANGYSGPTIINQGKIVVASGASLGTPSAVLTIGSGAVLDVSALGLQGYLPINPLTVAAGTPVKPYTNFLGSFDLNVSTNFIVSTTGTNNFITFATNTDLATFTNIVRTTNFVSLSVSTNTIVSVVNADVVGNFTVNGGGAISPITSISPGLATWSINGNLTLDNSLGLLAPNNKNRVNFLLNDTTPTGGGTNDLIAVSGTLKIGDELDFVITPLTGSLAAGTYTLITSSSYVPETGGHVPSFVLVEARGLVGDSVQASGNNITLTSVGGTATPGNIVWAGTPAANNWDVHLSQNWKLSGSPDYFFPQDNATFNDSGVGTIVLPVVVSPGSMTFNNNQTNYTFTQSQSTFVTGDGGLTKNGSGSVTLQNPNSFTGDITVNNGTLNLGYYGATSPQYVLYNGVAAGNLVLGGGTINQLPQQNTAPFAAFENLVLMPGASTIAQSARTASESPRYFFTNNLVRSVGGTLLLNPTTGNNCGIYFLNTNSPGGATYYGTNGILGGFATIFFNDWVNAASSGNAGVVAVQYSGYQKDNNPANWGAVSNVLVGAGSGNSTTINVSSSATINSLKLTNGGPVTLNISGGQTLTLASGGLLVPSASAYQSAINGGTLKGATNADLIVLNQNGTLGSSLTIGSVIADNVGACGLTSAGLGKTILTGNNTYTGPTYINNGYQGAAGGTLQIGANGTSGSIASSSAIIDNGILAFNRSDNDSVSGIISGSGSLTKLSSGVLTLTANNTLSGLVTVSSGTLQLGNGGASGSVSNTVGMVDNGSVVFDNNNTVSYSNPISGYGNLVQFGSGNLVIPTNETYSGNTIVSNGTMTLTATGYLTNTATIAVNAGAVLDVSALSGGGLTLRSASPAQSLSGAGTINGSIITAPGTVLSPGNNSGSGVVGTLTITNNLTLSGGNFNFDMPASGPTDRINVGGTLTENSGTVITIVSGGSLANGSYTLIHTTGGIVGLSSSLSLFGFNQPGQVAALANSGNDLTLVVSSGTITSLAWVGSGYGGAGDVWNTSANTWTNVAAGGPLTAYANPDFALFDDSISYTNPVDIAVPVSSTAVTVNANGANFVLGANTGSAQKLTGGASLVKNGGGTLTLQTTNDYLGTTVINAGVVQLGNNTAQVEDGLIGSGAVTLNGALVVSNFATETIKGAISGAGFLNQMGAGTLVLAGNNSAFSGPVSIGSSNLFLQMGNGVNGTLGTGNVTNNGTLLFDVGPTPVSTVAVNASISGGGGITNLGPGIVTLNGNNTFAGKIANDTGTIQVGANSAIPVTAAVFMDTAAAGGSVGTLDLNGHSINISSLQGAGTGNGNAGVLSSLIVNNGSGTATLTVGGGAATTFQGQLLDNNNSGSGVLALEVTNNSFLTLAPVINNVNAYTANLFSGGIIISNASMFIGQQGANSTVGGQGNAAAGLGIITLLGGHAGGVTNFNVQFPSNAVIFLPGSQGASTTPTLSTTFSGPVNVPAGEVGSIFGPARGTFSCTLTGSGILTYTPKYVRSQLSGDWSAFAGTIIFENFDTTANAGGGCAIGSGPSGGYSGATVFMQVSNLVGISLSGSVGGGVFPIGALSGGDNTSFIGGGTQANGTAGGAANTIWAIGNLNLTTTNGSQILDGGCGIRKVGTGQLVLTNSILSYGGQTVVSNGTLTFAPLGNLVFTNGGPPAVTNNVFIALTNNYLVGSNFTVVSPGTLDASQMGGTLYLGHNGTQTLFGNGTLSGNLVVTTNANSVISPGLRASDARILPGNLTVTGTILVNSNCNFRMNVNRTSSPAYDSITCSGTVPTIKEATLTVVNGGDTAFAVQSTNVFQFFAGAVPVNIAGTSGITNITVFTNLPAGMFWVTNLNGTLSGYPTVPAGAMAIVNTNISSLNPNPPTLQGVVSGNVLTLGWPTNAGWYLQSQTNPLSMGLIPTNTWVDVLGSQNVTQKVFTIDSNQPAVFFRMRNPSAPVQ